VTCEENDVSAVMIAVDPHKASNTGAVLDPVTKTLIESARFANTADGYLQLTSFAGRWARRRWAVEGRFGAGRSLAQRLVADGETVLDVPAKLAARVRVYSQGHGRKTDKDDAVSVSSPRTVMTAIPVANTSPAQSAAPISCGGRPGRVHGVVSAGPCHSVCSP
jgi:transposase